MDSINTYVIEIQKNNLAHFNNLMEKFKPLILSWLKKIHQLYTNETEDYMSIAKIILLECARKYDASKNVPFASYYKINLYHWYGNQMQKRKINCTSLETIHEESESIDFTEHLQKEKNVKLLKKSMKNLTKQERDILKELMEGQSALEIAKHLKLSKKTILNKKYIIIKKMRIAVEKEEHS